MLKFLSLAVFFLNFFPTIVSAKKGPDIETKIAIEKNLEERLRRILTEITGTDRIIVVVNVQLISTEENKKEEDQIVLPGVPLQEKLGLGLASLDLGDSSTLIKKLTCQIIVEKSLPDALVKVVKSVASGVLGIEQSRGDVLTVKKMKFRKNTFVWSDILYPPHLWGVVFSVFAVLFIIGVFIFSVKIFPQSVAAISDTLRSSLKKEEVSFAGGTGSIAPVTTVPGVVSVSSERTEDGIFSFVNAENIDKLIFILKDETPEKIAVVLNYLKEFSGVILSAIEEDKGRKAVSMLSRAQTLPASDIEKWAKELKEKVNYLVGGKEVVGQILSGLEEEKLDSFLDAIKKIDPKSSGEIEKGIFRLSQLLRMSKDELLEVFQNFNPASFAIVLSGLEKPQQDEILGKLPEGISRRLREEIEYAGQISREKFLEEKTKLAKLVSRLRKEGRIKEG